MIKRQNRPHMPSWFDPECAKWFRDNFSESEFKQFMEAKNGMIETAKLNGIPVDDVNHYWYKGKNYSIHAKTKVVDFKEVTKGLIEQIKNNAPKFEKIKRKKMDDPVMFCISPTDPHFGKLARAIQTGDKYNLKKAKQKFMDGINGLMELTNNFNIEQIVLVGGNDVLHVDGSSNTTTKGTRQDVTGMFYDSFNVAFNTYKECLQMLMQICDVTYIHVMSNHDYHSGWYLSKVLDAYFSDCENITFNTSPADRKYLFYGANLIGFSHGDGAKDSELIDLMKRECKSTWSKCRFGYWYLGHLHHHIRKENNKIKSKDHADVMIIKDSEKIQSDMINVQYLRSISGTDAWHFKQGYGGQPKGIEGFIHHPIDGQIARFTKFV